MNITRSRYLKTILLLYLSSLPLQEVLIYTLKHILENVMEISHHSKADKIQGISKTEPDVGGFGPPHTH